MAWATMSTRATGYVVLATDWNVIANTFAAVDQHKHSAAAGDGDDVFGSGSTSIAMNGRLLFDKGADLASGSAITPGADGNYFDITGTTTITSIATLQAGSVVIFQFDGVLQITHNGTTLILQNAANITTAAGDIFAFISEGSGNWREVWRRTVAPLLQATQAATEAETNEDAYVPPDFIRHSPGVAKAWCVWEQTGTHQILLDYNILSLTDGGAFGDTDHTIEDDFSGTAYVMVFGGQETATIVMRTSTQAAGTVTTISVQVSDAVASDFEDNMMALFGDQ